jgi:DNA-binding LacI/PurR family transcriptional regulator
MIMSGTVTRKDVARAAGVSVASVSRAVNNSGYVKKEIKERILETASRLGYNPNPIALSLQNQRTRQLILYQNEITAPYNVQFFNGATRAAYKRGYSVFLDVHGDFDRIKRHLVDGVIFSLDVLAEKYLELVGTKYLLPMVAITNDSSTPFMRPVHSVVIDNPKIIQLAIDYLKAHGHKCIGLVIPDRGKYSDLRYRLWKSRMESEIRNCVKKMDLDELVIRAEISDDKAVDAYPDPPLIMQPSDDNFENYSSFNIGKRAAKKYLSGKNPATAMLCFNDDIAYGFIRGLEREGLHVPEDISVMGIDGIYLREWFEKRVTTVSIDIENLGATAVNVLIDILEDKKPKYMNWTSPKILQGDTVRKIGLRGGLS